MSVNEIAEEVWGRPVLGSTLGSGRSVGRFAACKGEWDEAKQEYVDYLGSDIVQCCIDSCRPRALYCLQQCEHNLPSNDSGTPSPEEADKRWRRGAAERRPISATVRTGRCRSSCGAANDLCLQSCKVAAPGFNYENSYNSCALEGGCRSALGGGPDPLCTYKHHKEILNCCLDRCQPAFDTDCDKYCQFLQDLILNPESIGLGVGWGGRLHSTASVPSPPPDTTTINVSSVIRLAAKLTELSPSEIRSHLGTVPTEELKELAPYIGNIYYDYSTTSGDPSSTRDSQAEINAIAVGERKTSDTQLSLAQFQAILDVLQKREPGVFPMGSLHETAEEHEKLDALKQGSYRTYDDHTGRYIMIAVGVALLLIAIFLLWRRLKKN